jgi:hypothetical protein
VKIINFFYKYDLDYFFDFELKHLFWSELIHQCPMLKHFTTMLPFKHKWLNFKVSFKLHLFNFLGFESHRNRCEGLQCLCRLKVFLVLSKPSEYSGIET